MSALYTPVRQSLVPDRKPSSRLPRRLSAHSAWLRGRLIGLDALPTSAVPDILSRCDSRSERAFTLGVASPRDADILTPAQLDAVLDGPTACTCSPELWRGIPKARRRHCVACPRWGSPVVAH